MVKSNCEVCADQLFDVIAFDQSGNNLGVVCEGALLSGAIAFSRGFNANRLSQVAVVVEAPVHESELNELEAGDFSQSRDENETLTVWDWCAEGDHIERVDTIALDSMCATLIRHNVAIAGHVLPELGSDLDDMPSLCARLPPSVQLGIWNELRTHF